MNRAAAASPWFACLLGERSGRSTLYTPWLETQEHPCESQFHGTWEAKGNFAVRYSWRFEGKAQQGLLLCGGADAGTATAGWTDTWHQSGAVMQLRAEAPPADGLLLLAGTYPGGYGSEWGWRIELAPQRDTGLRMRMFCVPPGEAPYVAVDASYSPMGGANHSSGDCCQG